MKRIALLLVVAFVLAAPARAEWPPEKFTNLKVLPAEIPQRELFDMMAGFTRALGVRCSHCHVGEEGRPLETYDFAADDKEAKGTARVMMRMLRDLNAKYLAGVEHRADPPIRVECTTCHRGATEPRMLQDVLLRAYDREGIDSAVATYRRLREESYGRFTWDFGEVPLSDVATELWEGGHEDDALRLFALNLEMNPGSRLALRQHVTNALLHAFRAEGVEAGTRTYRELRGTLGEAAFPPIVLNHLGYRLLRDDRADLAIAVLGLNAEAFPQSSNAYDSLGEAYLKHGDRELAIENYRKALELDPSNDNARKVLARLESPAP